MRICRQIKLTDEELYQIRVLHANSDTRFFKGYLDDVIGHFCSCISSNTEVLAPSKSGLYRTIWLEKHVVEQLKLVSETMDVSQNAVIFTAVKRKIIQEGGR